MIEVVVATAIAGTLLVYSLVGASKHYRQMDASDRKRQCIQAVDRLLVEWSLFQFSSAKLKEAAQAAGVVVAGESVLEARGEAVLIEIQSKPIPLWGGIMREVVRVSASLQDGRANATPDFWLEIVREPSA